MACWRSLSWGDCGTPQQRENREHRDSTGENGRQRTRQRRTSLGKHDRGALAILANRFALLNDDCVSLVWGAEPLGDMDGLGDTRTAICAAARRTGGARTV